MITVDSSAFSPASQVELVQLSGEQSALTALEGPQPAATGPFGPAATVTLSPAAQALLDGQVSSMQVSGLEQSDGIDASAVAQLASETGGTSDASFDPADPFGAGVVADDGYDAASTAAAGAGDFDPANPWGTTSSATSGDAFDPADPFADTSA